jgi:hypothetical protein
MQLAGSYVILQFRPPGLPVVRGHHQQLTTNKKQRNAPKLLQNSLA